MASDLPEGILKKSAAAMNQLVPEKSSKRYDDAYNKFMGWRKEQNTESFVEDVFLAYFEDGATRYAPSTLWCMYSMLKSKLIANHNIDISRYSRLIAFVKIKNVGFQQKQASVFTPEEIKTFLLHAPDSDFLAVKVTMLLRLCVENFSLKKHDHFFRLSLYSRLVVAFVGTRLLTQCLGM